MRRCPSSSAPRSPEEIHELRPDVPIVLMSGYSGTQLLRACARGRDPGSPAQAAAEQGHRRVFRARFAPGVCVIGVTAAEGE